MRWIKYDPKNPPPIDTDVLLYDSITQEFDIGNWGYDFQPPEFRWHFLSENEYGQKFYEPTHWQPMPEPPEDDK